MVLRNRGSSSEKEIEYEMDFLNEDRLCELMELQDIAVKALPEPELFWPNPIDFFREIFKVERSVIGVSTEDGLIAYSLIYFPGDCSAQKECDNLGRDIELSEEDLRKVAHLQVTVVHPAYRGNSLQRRMARQHLKVLKEMGYEHILCTISPKNPASLRNLLQCGFVIKGLKRKFNGWWRYIMYKNVLSPVSLGSDEVRIDSSDIEGQIDLIGRGYIGCEIELHPKGFVIVYFKDRKP